MLKRIIERLYLRQKNNLAYYDVQTHVHNRNYYELVMKPRYEKKSIKVAIIDINNFKQINDTYGHLRGDKTLSDMGQMLRKFDCFCDVCRYGGDEFVAVYDKDVPFDVMQFYFRHMTGATFTFGEYCKDKDQSLAQAIEIADESLYRNKNQRAV